MTISTLLLTTALCDPNSASAKDVRAVVEGIVAADNQRDVGKVIDYYSPDAVLLPPGEPAVEGRDKIRPRYEQLFATFNPAIEGHIDEICVGAGLAYVRGHNGGKLQPKADGAPRLLDDAYVMILRRGPGGAWWISRLMWHSQSAAADAK